MLRPHELTKEARDLIALALFEWDEFKGRVPGVENLIELMLSDQVAISVVIANDAVKLG